MEGVAAVFLGPWYPALQFCLGERVSMEGPLDVLESAAREVSSCEQRHCLFWRVHVEGEQLKQFPSTQSVA